MSAYGRRCFSDDTMSNDSNIYRKRSGNIMADVQPLRAIRYVSETIGDLAQVVTPPFDVISEEAQARYYARHPYNVIRLELGQERPGDTVLNNRYTRAAATLAEWRLSGVLRQEVAPCYYAYQQVFTHAGKTYKR